ncbi:MAG: hypothetical protein AAB217_18255 [Chloroflexota bacterium]
MREESERGYNIRENVANSRAEYQQYHHYQNGDQYNDHGIFNQPLPSFLIGKTHVISPPSSIEDEKLVAVL